MDLTEKTLSRREIYDGRIVHLHVDEVELPDGSCSVREVIDHCPCVAVVALDEQDRVLTVTQYRYAFGRELLEIPAGKREKGEEPFVTAQRELQEETGATADHWLPCVMLSPSTPRWQWEKSLVTTEYSMLFSSALKLAAGILRLLPSL